MSVKLVSRSFWIGTLRSSAQLAAGDRLCLLALSPQPLNALAPRSAREVFGLPISRGRSYGEF